MYNNTLSTTIYFIIYKHFGKTYYFLKNVIILQINNIEIPPAGLEPATFGSTVQRSAKLS